MSLKLTHDLDARKVEKYFKGDMPYCTLDPRNVPKEDTFEWVENDRMDAIVGNDGIIGFIHKDYSEEVATALNVIVMRNKEVEEQLYIDEVFDFLSSMNEEDSDKE